MAIYICKCGRQVNKSTNADNTGNRDTDSCTGCALLSCITQCILGDLFQLIACVNEIGIDHDDYLIEGIVKAVMIAAKYK